MLFVPPCINKFYILDLQPENSLIRYAVEQGHRVFVVSWRNADESLAKRTWDDYIEDGADPGDRRGAGDHRRSEQINTLGFCVGGTILATALAVLAARGEQPAASMTLLTTLLDFSDTGVLDIFIDEAVGADARDDDRRAERRPAAACCKGQELATTFSFLRPNDLVWNYVVGNYLKGETPPPFDLLYWNSDGTNLPGPMYCWYLRNTYLENKLERAGRADGLRREDRPRRDRRADLHLRLARGPHRAVARRLSHRTQLLKGKRRFVLGASGHIAGVINPPAKKKRSHWIGNGSAAGRRRRLARPAPRSTPAAGGPTGPPGSSRTPASRSPRRRRSASRKYKAIEPAPGRYVKAKA